MRIAIVGAGIAGLGAAHLLGREHEVVLFEAGDHLGGHTHTHDIEIDGQRHAVDTGFIVFNPGHYPLLTRLLGELGIESQPTVMSFAVRNERSGLEYNATNLNRMFAQRRNLLSPTFWGMVRDIVRFYREAPALLTLDGAGPSLGDYCAERRYGSLFVFDHIVPMASALWSSPTAQVLKFPAKYLVQFMANHQMLSLGDRAPWRVVRGGSRSYVEALRPKLRAQIRQPCAVHAVRRDQQGALLTFDGVEERFDEVILACHGDQALALLSDPTARERDVLGAMRYQANDTVLHTDTSLLPRRKACWASWNALIPTVDSDQCTVSYWMNLLQTLHAPVDFIVTLNRTELIDPATILRRLAYHHPVYDHASVAAQQRWAEINGQQHTWFCGAYWGWGFHEDGLRSGVRVAEALGAKWV